MSLLPVFTVVAIPAALVGGIIALELAKPDAPLTEALRRWQSGLGALAGLFGVALSLLMGAAEADRQQRTREYHEGLVVAMSMQVEGLAIRQWLARLDAELASNKLASPNSTSIQCSFFFDWLNRHPFRPLGIIESQLGNVGKMPNLLGLWYTQTLINQRDLERRISETKPDRCKDDGASLVDVITEGMGNVRRSLDSAQKVIESLPEVELTKIRY